jgi:DNA-binding PadR family transcriptional regulator
MARSRKSLTPAGQHILLALLDGEQHGYALIRTVEEQSDGSVRMGPGTLYGTLQRLVEQGLIEETTDRETREGERRRYYELTGAGRALALDELARLRSLVERFGRHAGPATA